MKKYLASLISLAAVSFPQVAMAHFESPHEPFWHEPMHFIVEHYVGLMAIAVGILAIAVSLKTKTKKSNEKMK